jgi:hypothetical protein
VAKGLEEIGVERHEDKAKIAVVTKVYLSNPQTSSDLVACAGALGCQCTWIICHILTMFASIADQILQIAVEVEEPVREPTYSKEIVMGRPNATI